MTVRTWMLISAVMLGLIAAGLAARPTPAQDMARQATAFLDSLTPEQRARTALAFDAPERLDWHYVPREGSGIELGQMDDGQRIAARNLMRSTLSSQGMNKVEEIMQLDIVLAEIERGRGPRRDPLAYTITVFGVPGEGAWGWKLEGHHISLNFTGAAGRAAVTPAFLGSNPAEVRAGSRAGVRVLAAEEDLGRLLLESLDPGQRREAILGASAPSDITAVPGRSLDEVDSSGLAVSSMDDGQRELVERLLEEYAGNLRHELAQDELDRIRAAGIENVRFAWMGGQRRGEGHYYRLSGPTFVIEYDNTQNGANHIHTVWRDRERDFGLDLLAEHHEHSHAPR